MNKDQAQTAHNRTERDLNELIERCDRILDGISVWEALESTGTHQCHTARNQACLGLFALYNGDLFGALDSAYMAQRIMRVAESAMTLPYVERSIANSQLQSVKGQSGAAARWGGREIIHDVVKRLAGQRDALGDYLPPAELWEPLFSDLEDEGIDRDAYITYDTFRRQVQRQRKK